MKLALIKQRAHAYLTYDKPKRRTKRVANKLLRAQLKRYD